MIDSLNIDSLAYGGNGVGRHQGKAVFVPFAAPGDRIRCRITREKKRFSEGDLEEILIPSTARREPPCPVFGECGGCQWQHLSYSSQARWKERIFIDTLQRHCGIAPDLVRTLVCAPDEWGYRSRVQFKCRAIQGRFVMGFYRRGSHYVIDLDGCPVATPLINQEAARLRRWLAASPCPDRIPQVDLSCDDEGKSRAVVHVLQGHERRLAEYLAPLAEETDLSLFLQVGRKEGIFRICGAENLHIHPMENTSLRLAYGPGGFAQINLPQNRRLVAEVLAAAELEGHERVLDLFCGMGNFSLPLARRAAEVVGVEDFAPAILKARKNAEANGITNVRFLARSAEGACSELGAEQAFQLVVLDPTRAGSYRVIKELLRVRPDRIIYVSCDPQTLARDLLPLASGGYEIVWSRPFDLFPQTFHTESVTVLKLCR